jgi:RNA polymerase sigma factor (sigma-70 family)
MEALRAAGVQTEKVFRRLAPEAVAGFVAQKVESRLAFEDIVRRYRHRIFGYLKDRAHPADSEDLVQQTLMLLWAGQFERYDAAKGPLDAYVFGVARHVAASRARARRRSKECALPEHVLDKQDVSGALEAQEQALAELEVAVAALPQKERDVVTMRKNSMTLEQMAKQLGVSVATAHRLFKVFSAERPGTSRPRSRAPRNQV